MPQALPTDKHIFYLASKQTKRKVVYEEGRGYYCERDQQYYQDAVPTYNFTVKLSDMTGSVSAQCMGEVGDIFMGMTATQFCNEMKDDLEEIKDQASKVMMNQNLSLVISAKVENSMMNSHEEGPRIRYTIVRAIPHDFKAENSELLKKLAMYQNNE